jgi:hypothetical protein
MGIAHTSGLKFRHTYHLIPPKVNHLHSNSFVLTRLEGGRDGAPYTFEDLQGDLCLERLLELLPGIGIHEEEGLAHVQGRAVAFYYSLAVSNSEK